MDPVQTMSCEPVKVKTQIEEFAEFLGRELSLFQKKMHEAFGGQDEELADTLALTVDYVYKAAMDGLTATFTCSNNKGDNRNLFLKLSLTSPVSSPLSYDKLDDEQLSKISKFIKQEKNLAVLGDGHSYVYAQNMMGSNYLTKVQFIACRQFDFNPEDSASTEQLSRKLADFDQGVKKLGETLDGVLETLFIEPSQVDVVEPSLISNRKYRRNSHHPKAEAILERINAFKELVDVGQMEKYCVKKSIEFADKFRMVNVVYQNTGGNRENLLLTSVTKLNDFSFDYSQEIQNNMRVKFNQLEKHVRPEKAKLVVMENPEHTGAYSLQTASEIVFQTTDANNLGRVMDAMNDSTKTINENLRGTLVK